MTTSMLVGQAPTGTERSNALPEAPVTGMTPWLLLLRSDLQRLPDEAMARQEHDGIEYEVRLGRRALWVLARWPSGARLAVCAANALGNALEMIEQVPLAARDGGAPGVRVRLRSDLGDYVTSIALPTDATPLLHWETALTPGVELLMPEMPHDLVPITDEVNPLDTHGILHASQLGIKGGVLHASLTRPAGGSLLYVQDFGALTDYFQTTRSTPADSVGGHWPELGFVLPATTGPTLQPRQSYTLASAYLALDHLVPKGHLDTAEQFIELYARVYRAMPHPSTSWRDWPQRVHETLRDLTHSPLCRMEVDGEPYLRAYVGMEGTPPESMVQLALLVPLIEYARSRRVTIPLIDELAATVERFLDPELQTVVRHLPGLESWLAADDEQVPYQMDSWYLYHAIHNLCRLALFGADGARELALRSVEFGIRVAHHFNYRWPVFYDLRTLDVQRAEAEPGEGGENDVGGQYAQVMLLAHRLTGDERYVDEARRAADAMFDFGFTLGYQFNNTAFGAVALSRLAEMTGDERYRRLARVCIANILRNLWLWDCGYGVGVHYGTFLGLPPLRHAPYLAMYEELEALAAFHEYLEIGGDTLLDGERLLLAEYTKYLVDRGWTYYPAELPGDILATESHSGHLDRRLAIPLEDLYDGWTAPGSVGQEVYGAAAPFVIATLQVLPVLAGSFSVHVDYPVVWDQRTVKGGGQVELRLLGTRDGVAQIRIVPEPSGAMPLVTARASGGRSASGRRARARTLRSRLDDFGQLLVEAPGDATVTLEWPLP